MLGNEVRKRHCRNRRDLSAPQLAFQVGCCGFRDFCADSNGGSPHCSGCLSKIWFKFSPEFRFESCGIECGPQMHDPPHKNKPQGRSQNEVDQCGDWTPLNELPQTGGEKTAHCSNDISSRTLPVHFDTFRSPIVRMDARIAWRSNISEFSNQLSNPWPHRGLSH